MRQGETVVADEIEACVVYIEELQTELRGAIQAIAGNRAKDFAASVPRQLRLAEMLKDRLPSARRMSDSGAAGPEWTQRLSKTSRSLELLNEEYAALLEYSSRSIRMLFKANQLQSDGQSSHAAGRGAGWSCTA